MNDKESRVYDLTVVKEASDDAEYLKEITQYFILNCAEMLKVLEQAVVDEDWDTAQHAAHKLTSNFYLFGLNEGGKALSHIDINLLNKTGHPELPQLVQIAKKQGELAIEQLKRDFA